MADDRGLISWIERRRAESRLHVERVKARTCNEWSMSDTEIRHQSGRYFQVVGARVDGGAFDGREQPMISQHEIGILGFLVRLGEDRNEWLVQAKTEPGNAHGTQVAPSVQATESNYQQVHGGDPTRHLEWFTATRSSDGRAVAASRGG